MPNSCCVNSSSLRAQRSNPGATARGPGLHRRKGSSQTDGVVHLTIRAPKPDATFDGETIDVEFDVRSPSGLAVDRVDAQIDGRPVEARGVTPASASGERHVT